ncbi:MAG: FHA domain-containing serine/threonine-protein kinase, partial [Anaerolineae bacterium]
QNYQYIVMEYLEGPTLQQEIQAQGALPMDRCLHLLGQLAEALDYAHRQGLIHRDVKPANVMIGPRDHVTLTDFGLVKAVRTSKITGEGNAIGTLKYMSPEQAAGKELDSRSDIYSLGVVVYEMLTGESPFTGTTPFQTLQELMHKPPPPFAAHRAAVPASVEQVVFQALAKDPKRRFSTAGEFARAMTDAAGVHKPAHWRSDTDAIARNVALLLLGADGREFPVYTGRVLLGRDVSNDIIIPNQQVSRNHARIRCRGQACTIVDLQSTNGTSINGVPVPAGEPRPLRPGDVLGVGPVNLLVVAPSEEAQNSSKTATMQYTGI